MADIQSVRQQAAASVTALRQLMAGLGLDDNIGVWHEFVPHAASNIQQIRDAAKAVDRLPKSDPEFFGYALTVGSALSSIGEVKEAERFISEARKKAPNADQRAFAGYSLFWVRLRLEQWDDALDVLMTAVRHDPKKYAIFDANRFRPMKILGAGALGAVFQCENPDGGRPVIVRTLWEPVPGIGAQAFADVEALRQVATEAIVLPKETGFALPETQERPFLVYERQTGFVNGEEWLAKNGPMSAEQGMALGRELLQILQLAHSVGVAHYDLKPRSLWFKQVGASFQVALSDFGMLRAAVHLRQRALSQPDPATKSFIGKKALESLDYTAPELKSGGRAGFQSDFYSFASVMYRFFTGDVPRETSGTKLPNIAGLYQLLLTCRDENPAKRPPTATGLAKWWAEPGRGPEAAGIASGVGTARVADPTTGAVSDAPIGEGAPPKSKLPLFIGVGVGAVAILGVILFFALGGKKKDEGGGGTKEPTKQTTIDEKEARRLAEWYEAARGKVFDFLAGTCKPLHEAGYKFESHMKPERKSKTVKGKIREYSEIVLELRPAKSGGSGALDIFDCVSQLARIHRDHPITLDLFIRFYQASMFSRSQRLAVFRVEGKYTGYLTKRRFDSVVMYKTYFSLPGLRASDDEGIKVFSYGLPYRIDEEGIKLANVMFKREGSGKSLEGRYKALLTSDKFKREVNDWAASCKNGLKESLAKTPEPSSEHKKHQQYYAAAKDWSAGFCEGIDKLSSSLEPYSESGVSAALGLLGKARENWNTNIYKPVQKLVKEVGKDIKAPAL